MSSPPAAPQPSKRIDLEVKDARLIFEPVWEALVTQHQVTGKPAHDARLAAAMQAHGLTAILTFDKSGFSRYPGLEVVHPENVKA